MVTYYVYELADPRTDQVFYVGKGQRSRINAHEDEARKGVQSEKCERIREIEARGLSVIKRKVATFDDEQDAFDAEAELIERYGLKNLTNVVPGGGTARNTPTLYADRLRVSATAEILNRTKGGSITAVLVAGERLDLSEIIEQSLKKCAEVVSRRGVDWANGVSERFGVEFVHADA